MSSIGGTGATGGFISLAQSSGIDSIATGLMEASQTGGPAFIKKAMDAFSEVRPQALSQSSTGQLQRSAVADSGHVDNPHKFFSKLSLTPSSSSGNFSAVELEKKLREPATTLGSDLKNLSETFQGQLSSMTDLSEEQQLKMQMVMDRMSKADSMLSNLMKLMSDTSSQIMQNLK